MSSLQCAMYSFFLGSCSRYVLPAVSVANEQLGPATAQLAQPSISQLKATTTLWPAIGDIIEDTIYFNWRFCAWKIAMWPAS